MWCTSAFDVCLVTLAHILSTSPFLVFFVVFRSISKVKKKGCMVRSSVLFHFFCALKMTTVVSKLLFFSVSHTQTHKFRFQLMNTFFHCLSSSTASGSLPDSTIYCTYGLLLLSRAPQDSIDTQQTASRLFPLLYM